MFINILRNVLEVHGWKKKYDKTKASSLKSIKISTGNYTIFILKSADKSIVKFGLKKI